LIAAYDSEMILKEMLEIVEDRKLRDDFIWNLFSAERY
jgi:hypothetical protein